MNAPADPRFADRIRYRFSRRSTPGRTLTVTRGEVYARDGKHVATMQQTLTMLTDTSDTTE